MMQWRAFAVQKADDPGYAENMKRLNGCFRMGRDSVTSQNKKFKLDLKSRRLVFFSVSNSCAVRP